MTTRFRFTGLSAVLMSLLFVIGVQAQAEVGLTVNVTSGTVEVSSDDGATYAPAVDGVLLEANDQFRWSADAAGRLLGPDSSQIIFDGATLGAGELRVDAVDDPDTTTGLRLQQLAGQVAYANEHDRAELDAFLALEDAEQMLDCTNRQLAYVAFIPDPAAIAATSTAPLVDAAVKVVDASDESYGLLSSGWLFMLVDEDGLFSGNSWTMDANFETNIAGLVLRRDTTQPDYTIVDRYCHDAVLVPSATAAAKFESVTAKPMMAQQDPLSFVIPAPGTTIEYTVDPETGAITITMSPGGQASFIVPEGGLPAGVTILVDGYEIELDTTQAGSLSLVSSGDGVLSATGAGGGATITSPQGVVLTLSSSDPAIPAQAAITDTGTGPVSVEPLAGIVGLETSGVPVTVTLADGSTIDVPGGSTFALIVSYQPNGAVQVFSDPANPAALSIVPPPAADGTPSEPIILQPGGETAPTCPGGVQPSGVGGACPPV